MKTRLGYCICSCLVFLSVSSCKMAFYERMYSERFVVVNDFVYPGQTGKRMPMYDEWTPVLKKMVCGGREYYWVAGNGLLKYLLEKDETLRDSLKTYGYSPNRFYTNYMVEHRDEAMEVSEDFLTQFRLNFIEKDYVDSLDIDLGKIIRKKFFLKKEFEWDTLKAIKASLLLKGYHYRYYDICGGYFWVWRGKVHPDSYRIQAKIDKYWEENCDDYTPPPKEWLKH